MRHRWAIFSCGFLVGATLVLIEVFVQLGRLEHAVEQMRPKVNVEAALDGQTLYRVQTCEGATVWLQTPDLLSQGVE
jgi:hypothetical protein